MIELLSSLSFVKAKPLSKAKAERVESLLQALAEVEEIKSGKRKAKTLKEVYPWGTIRIPTPEVNVATMNQLTEDAYLGTAVGVSW